MIEIYFNLYHHPMLTSVYYILHNSLVCCDSITLSTLFVILSMIHSLNMHSLLYGVMLHSHTALQSPTSDALLLQGKHISDTITGSNG